MNNTICPGQREDPWRVSLCRSLALVHTHLETLLSNVSAGIRDRELGEYDSAEGMVLFTGLVPEYREIWWLWILDTPSCISFPSSLCRHTRFSIILRPSDTHSHSRSHLHAYSHSSLFANGDHLVWIQVTCRNTQTLQTLGSERTFQHTFHYNKPQYPVPTSLSVDIAIPS